MKYGKIIVHLNINGDGNTSGKKTCSLKTEYIRIDDDGINESVSIYDDGFVYKSKPCRLPMQRVAIPITSEEFERAYNGR